MSENGWIKNDILPRKANNKPNRFVRVRLNLNNKQLDATGHWALDDAGVTVDFGSHIIANCQGNCGGNCVGGCTGSCTGSCGSGCSSGCTGCGGACSNSDCGGGCSGCSGPGDGER